MAKLLRRLLQKFLLVFFSNLYTRFAWLYDAVAWLSSMGQWRLWRQTAIIPFQPGFILELGHGPGHLQKELQQSGYPSMGIDPSRQMNRLAQRRLAKEGLAHDLVRAKAQSLPFKDQSFHGIVSTFPSDYILDPATLSEVHRVLSKHAPFVMIGYIVITGQALPDRFARWLYRITGQSGSIPPGWQSYLDEYGFDTRLEEVTLERSCVTRLLAMRKE